MGIGQKLNQLATNVQTGVHSGAVTVLTWTLKVFSALVIGLTIALIAQEMIGFNTFMLAFMMTLSTGLIIKLVAQWSLGTLIVFDLICILVALLLRTYILIAP